MLFSNLASKLFVVLAMPFCENPYTRVILLYPTQIGDYILIISYRIDNFGFVNGPE